MQTGPRHARGHMLARQINLICAPRAIKRLLPP